MIKLIAFSGSIRKDSLNKKLLAVAVGMVGAKNIEIEVINLADYDMPIYNGDIEASAIPDNAIKLHGHFKKVDGFIIASPEYNSSFSPLLKNVIDWVSRPMKGEKSLSALSNKTVLVISASMGNLGGLRGLYQLRSVLENIGIFVLPTMFSLPSAHLAFDEKNDLSDANYKKMLEDAVGGMIDFTTKLKSE